MSLAVSVSLTFIFNAAIDYMNNFPVLIVFAVIVSPRISPFEMMESDVIAVETSFFTLMSSTTSFLSDMLNVSAII